MNKRPMALLFMAFLSLSLLFSETISFSGGESVLIMREGEKSVSLKNEAVVTTCSIHINADEMTLSGDNWKTISAKGDINISDEER